MTKWIIILMATVAAYALIDFSYHIQWHIAALLLRGTGGAILTFIGMVIKEIEEKWSGQ